MALREFLKGCRGVPVQSPREFAAALSQADRCVLELALRVRAELVIADDLALRRAFVGAEPYTEDTRRKIEQALGVDVYNSYGLSEMNGPGVAFECRERRGLHLWEDHFLMEIVDPQTGEAVWVIDKKLTSKDAYRVRMNRRSMESDLVMFAGKGTTLFGLLEPRTFRYLTKADVLDGRREAEPAL